MKINLNFTIFFTILLASLLLSSCGKKEIFGNCDKICKVRVNIKNGSNFNDENGFGEFNRNGSPPVCSERGVWPSFNLMINGKRMVINKQQRYDRKGLSNWFRLEECVESEQIYQEILSGKQLNINVEKESINNPYILVRDINALCSSHGCLVYKIDFTKIRITLDKENCGINIDIKAFPDKINGRYKCEPCKC